MKGFFLFLLGVVVGVGAGYVAFEHNGGLLPGDRGLRLNFADHFLKTLAPGDRVSLREGRYGYSMDVLEASAADAAEKSSTAQDTPGAEQEGRLKATLSKLAGLPGTYEVVKVRRDHVVLRSENHKIMIPVSKISSINVKAEPESAQQP